MMKKWTSDEITLAKSMLRGGSTFNDIAKRVNRTTKAVRLKLNKLNIFFKDYLPEKVIRHCKCCGEEILNYGLIYCSATCSAKINNVKYPKRSSTHIERDGRIIKIKAPINNCHNCGSECRRKYCDHDCQIQHKYNINISNWKAGCDKGYTGKTVQLKPYIRKYMLEKSAYKCSKCGWDEKHPDTDRIPLEINHIDGDAENCAENNLEVLCPNCHSLTPNFRSLNKNSKRNRK